MKRWSPILFLGLSLLATAIVEISYSQYLMSWTPYAENPIPQPIGLLIFLSLPVGLILLWHCWRPNGQRLASLPHLRQYCGNILLGISIAAWIYFCIDSVVDSWVATTPTPDPLKWLRISSFKSTLSLLSLCVGGLTSLWCKGIHMPPR